MQLDPAISCRTSWIFWHVFAVSNATILMNVQRPYDIINTVQTEQNPKCLATEFRLHVLVNPYPLIS